MTVRSIAKIREVYASTDLRMKLARHHAHVDETFRGWNDIWLNPEFRKWNIQDRLAGVRCPVLVIQGVDDEYGTMEQVAAIRRGVTQAPVETLLLPECGHSPHRDRREQTLEAIVEFVGRIG
jgi:pimeloyl-ACP methyl ester carboxylesterase